MTLDPETKAEIEYLFVNGWTRNDISKFLHVGHNTVQQVIANVDDLEWAEHSLENLDRNERIKRKAVEHNIDRKLIREATRVGKEAQYNPELEERARIYAKGVFSPCELHNRIKCPICYPQLATASPLR